MQWRINNFQQHLYLILMSIADNQVFIALFLALATGIFAVRLGVALYK